jgi:hypothetical protein
MTHGGPPSQQWHHAQPQLSPAVSKLPAVLGIAAFVWVPAEVLFGPAGTLPAFLVKIAVDLLVLLGAVLVLSARQAGAILIALGTGITLVAYGVSFAAQGSWLAFPGNPGIAWRAYLLGVFTLVLLILAVGPVNKALGKPKPRLPPAWR